MYDNPGAMEAYHFRRVLAGIEELPEQSIEGVLAVTKEDIVAVADKMKICAVYFLEGTSDTEDFDDE